MSGFDTYADLKDRIYADTARPATTWGNEFIGFVRRAESRIFRGSSQESVRVRDMETIVDDVVMNGDCPLPERYLEPIAITWLNGTSSFEPVYAPPRDISIKRQVSGGDRPLQYTIDGDTIKLWPAVTGVLSINYVKAYAPLSADADTNWLMTNCPDVYFNAVLIEAYRYLRDDARYAMVNAEYLRAAKAARDSYGRSKSTPTSVRRVSAFSGVGGGGGIATNVQSSASSGVEW